MRTSRLSYSIIFKHALDEWIPHVPHGTRTCTRTRAPASLELFLPASFCAWNGWHNRRHGRNPDHAGLQALLHALQPFCWVQHAGRTAPSSTMNTCHGCRARTPATCLSCLPQAPTTSAWLGLAVRCHPHAYVKPRLLSYPCCLCNAPLSSQTHKESEAGARHLHHTCVLCVLSFCVERVTV